MASSRIEGLVVGGRRLLRADAARRLGEEVRDDTAAEVLANVDAMVWGVEAVEPGAPITLDILLEIHRRLLKGTRLEDHGGRIRTVQNWIGGSGYNPCSAAFVPPPPEDVPALLDDLMVFCNDDGSAWPTGPPHRRAFCCCVQVVLVEVLVEVAGEGEQAADVAIAGF